MHIGHNPEFMRLLMAASHGLSERETFVLTCPEVEHPYITSGDLMYSTVEVKQNPMHNTDWMKGKRKGKNK
jgi:hypothetical protein